METIWRYSAICNRYKISKLLPTSLTKLLSEDHPSCVLIWFLTGTIRQMRSISNFEVFWLDVDIAQDEEVKECQIEQFNSAIPQF